MDRIARLRELEKLADKPVRQNDAERWEAAHIYWQEVEAGRPKRDLAREIGKSAQHVVFMYRCWDITVVRTGIEYDDYASLPPFGPVYNSDEVRGRSEPEREDRPRAGKREPRYREPDDIHSQAMRIAREAYKMERRPKSWPELDEAGRKALRRAQRTIELVLQEK